VVKTYVKGQSCFVIDNEGVVRDALYYELIGNRHNVKLVDDEFIWVGDDRIAATAAELEDTAPRVGTCADCLCAVPLRGDDGQPITAEDKPVTECRRFPPRAGEGWPKVFDTDYCFEFMPRPPDGGG
jgi:hypothetical protein